MSAIHRGLTVTVIVKEEKLSEINTLLEEYNQQAKNNQAEYRTYMPSTFFISWLTLPSQVYAEKEKLPARIVLLTSYVGNKKRHLKEMAGFLESQLKTVFAHSEEFKSTANDNEGLVKFLNQKSIFNTFYSGFKFIQTQDVKKELDLRNKVFDFINAKREEPGFSQQNPEEIKEQIEDFVKTEEATKWATGGLKSLKMDKFNMLTPLFIFGLVMATSIIFLILSIFMKPSFLFWIGLIFPVFLIGLLILLLLLRINENNLHIPNKPVSDDWIRNIVLREKNIVINEMTVIAPLKKGLIRRIFLGVSLRLVYLIRFFSYIPTVHTARWLQMDSGKRLVFIATFDNLSEAYAHDFVDSENRTRNMAVIFSHAAGFPATTWLVKKSYNHRSEYMKGVRAHQKITQFWYTFNTDLSVENLKTNRKFREGLFKKMSAEEIREWLLTI
jgi:hypothetical protein